MREIKFRAWDEKKKDFRFFHLWHSHSIGTDLPIPSKGLWDHFEKFEQYTGLKDKFDKEIYEGDIVACSSLPIKGQEMLGKIEFKEGAFFIVLDSGTQFPMCANDYFLEVKGNIYEKQVV